MGGPKFFFYNSSFAKMANKHTIAYNVESEPRCLTVHMLNKKVDFKQNEMGLLLYKPTYGTEKNNVNLQLVKMMDENYMNLTNQQFEHKK